MTSIDPYLLNEYIEAHSTAQDPVLNALYRETHLHVMNPRMASGQLQGRFLQFICQMLRPKKVLEIGTFTGYSCICMARGIDAEARITTIEANEEYEDIIRKYLGQAAVEEKVRLIIGDAKNVIPTLPDTFDLVFIDADKISYPTYYDLIIEKVNAGGFILADNVLWEGKVLNAKTKERDTKAIIAFNDKVNADPRVENVLLPIRDGLMIIRKL
ncbi:MAG: O-methyltransferase [Bacteroidales bacterium]|nr:O-methyltransferase [Bacteroidales bacterium]